MKKTLLLPILGAAVATALVAPVAGAAEDLPDHSLEEWSVGETLSGDKVALDELDGKVVVIEYWGTR